MWPKEIVEPDIMDTWLFQCGKTNQPTSVNSCWKEGQYFFSSWRMGATSSSVTLEWSQNCGLICESDPSVARLTRFRRCYQATFRALWSCQWKQVLWLKLAATTEIRKQFSQNIQLESLGKQMGLSGRGLQPNLIRYRHEVKIRSWCIRGQADGDCNSTEKCKGCEKVHNLENIN